MIKHVAGCRLAAAPSIALQIDWLEVVQTVGGRFSVLCSLALGVNARPQINQAAM